MRDPMPVARAVVVPLAAVDAPDTPGNAPVGGYVRLSGERGRVEVEQQAVVEGVHVKLMLSIRCAPDCMRAAAQVAMA